MYMNTSYNLRCQLLVQAHTHTQYTYICIKGLPTALIFYPCLSSFGYDPTDKSFLMMYVYIKFYYFLSI